MDNHIYVVIGSDRYEGPLGVSVHEDLDSAMARFEELAADQALVDSVELRVAEPGQNLLGDHPTVLASSAWNDSGTLVRKIADDPRLERLRP